MDETVISVPFSASTASELPAANPLFGGGESTALWKLSINQVLVNCPGSASPALNDVLQAKKTTDTGLRFKDKAGSKTSSNHHRTLSRQTPITLSTPSVETHIQTNTHTAHNYSAHKEP